MDRTTPKNQYEQNPDERVQDTKDKSDSSTRLTAEEIAQGVPKPLTKEEIATMWKIDKQTRMEISIKFIFN